MSSQLRSANPPAYDAVQNIVARATGEDPAAIGDGKILAWLIANGPAIMQFILMIFGAFQKPPVTPPGPVG